MLGRDEIVRTAMDLADEAGPAAMTMKAIAADLGDYTPMALYRHIPNKDTLIDLMLETAVAEIPLPPEPGDDWRADLRELAMRTRQMTVRHPWFAQLVHTRPPSGPRRMRRLEFMLDVLVRQGADVATAMTYAALIDRHIYGSGLQEAEEARFSRDHGLDDTAALYAAFATLHAQAAADGDFPHLTRWLAHPAGPSVDDQFALGLDFILDGIAARFRDPGLGQR
ncbi:TetR/AcrR family transcriptional regulator C-terminal domain-containing protein [Streptosporangiaceae bacterium NEAU-GS5]|nr:TetR/AcrR family transcriptional regulator C-terminal domain-containing protein [Streptosporangiaceae bacterium NEAU-GS5]